MKSSCWTPRTTWDGENRLLGVNAAGAVETYTYSGDGLRKKKVTGSASRQLIWDNSNLLVWLFLPNSMPLEIYLQTLKKLQSRSAEFRTIYPGHGQPMPSSFIGEQIACVEGILDGSIKGQPQHFFTGDAMVAKYKTAAVAYNPENLRAKK